MMAAVRLEEYLTKEVKRLLKTLREEFYLTLLLHATENPLLYKPKNRGFTVPQLERVAEGLGLSECFVAKTAYRVYEKLVDRGYVKCTDERRYIITKAGTKYIREYVINLYENYEKEKIEPWWEDRYNAEKICLELQKRKKHVLVIGDVMLDHVLYGRIAGFTEVLNHGLSVYLQESLTEPYITPAGLESENFSPGGAAWLARALAEVAEVTLLGIIGSKKNCIEEKEPDYEGKRLIESLHEKVDFKYILGDKAPTICKNYFLLPKKEEPRIGYTGVRLDREDRKLMYKEVEEFLADQIITCVKNVLETKRTDAIVIDDYEKGVISPKVLREIARLRRNVSIFIDPKYDWHKFEGIEISAILPNIKEALFGSGLAEKEVALIHGEVTTKRRATSML
ncbi:MAG: hypothetical protein QMD36_06680 [Candidatus Aenigmarchaeota archaeon]|nr:hypothetical protein [Candidatus Aenigmarchaeota archaeon]